MKIKHFLEKIYKINNFNQINQERVKKDKIRNERRDITTAATEIKMIREV